MDYAKIAEECRAHAKECDQRAAESFERCDTDGFLTQYASRLSAELSRTRADIADQKGVWTFCGLYKGDTRIKAKIVKTAYGRTWLIHEDSFDLVNGRRFIPLAMGGTSRIQKGLGLTERFEIAPAFAMITGEGYGLSGTAWVEIIRSGDKWGLDSILEK